MKILLAASLVLLGAHTGALAQSAFTEAPPAEVESAVVRRMDHERETQMRALRQQQNRLAREKQDMRNDTRKAAPTQKGALAPNAAPAPAAPKGKPRCVGVCD